MTLTVLNLISFVHNLSNAWYLCRVFANMVPKLLAYDESLANSLDSLVNDLVSS